MLTMIMYIVIWAISRNFPLMAFLPRTLQQLLLPHSTRRRAMFSICHCWGMAEGKEERTCMLQSDTCIFNLHLILTLGYIWETLR